MLETTETDDLQKLAQADVAFHDVIYQATNNERLIQLLNNLREQMYRYRIEYLKDVKSRRSLVEEHDALYERMKNRDLAGAQKMIREHIERQQESIMQTVHHQSMTGVEENKRRIKFTKRNILLQSKKIVTECFFYGILQSIFLQMVFRKLSKGGEGGTQAWKKRRRRFHSHWRKMKA